MLQRHEHLLSPPMPAGHIIRHNRDAACETVFVPKPLEDPLRGMLPIEVVKPKAQAAAA
jgi:hypothetical protein